MKKTLPIIAIILICGLALVINWLSQSIDRKNELIKQLKIKNELDSTYWIIKGLKSEIKANEAKKEEAHSEQVRIEHHYHHYLNSIKTSPDSVQYTLRDTLVAKYRMMDKVPYIDSNPNREVNYRMAQGLEAKELVIAKDNELEADSNIMADQKAVIANNERTISDMGVLADEKDKKLDRANKDKETETKRKKGWRKVALAEGGVITVVALLLFL